MAGVWTRPAVAGMELFFPELCAICNRPLWPSGRAHVCGTCRGALHRRRLVAGLDRLRERPLLAACRYDFPLDTWIPTAKSTGPPGLFDELADELLLAIRRLDLQLYAQAVVPVPLHPARRRERGFDQAVRLGRRLASGLKVDFFPRALRRIQATRAQKVARRLERLTALKGAFAPGPQGEAVCGRRVILLDDVVTTGATIEAALDGLQRCLPAGVLLLCVARTEREFD